MWYTKKRIFRYISRFYQTTDTKLDALSIKIKQLQDHITKIHGLEYPPEAIPNAYGHTKLIQDACLKLLRMVDRILSDSNIPYFISYGNLLGAVRNAGFISWDDDVDINLMRKDFDSAVSLLTDVFNKRSYGFSTSWGISGGIFKVLFINKICVDLFPCDYYYKPIESATEYEEFIKKYNIAMAEARAKEDIALESRTSENPDVKFFGYNKIRDEVIMGGLPPDHLHGEIFEGIDWQTYPERMEGFTHCRPFKHEWVFPLGTIDFCGYKFPAPCNPDAFLTTRYGDWQAFKPSFIRHASPNFTYQEVLLLRKFIDDKNIDIRNI